MHNLLSNHRYDYLATERDYAWGLYVTGTGMRIVPNNTQYQTKEPKAPYQWTKGRILEDFGIIYIIDGKGSFESNLTKETDVSEGSILLLFPSVWHNYKPDINTGWTEFWVLFNGEHAKWLLKNGILNPANPILRPGKENSLMQLFKDLQITAETRPYAFNHILASTALQILSRSISLNISKEEHNYKEVALIEEAIIYLENNFKEPIDLEKLADSLCLSYRNFRKQFKICTGFSPHQYQLNFRINLAKTYIAETDYNISEIALRLGFEDVYYFSRLFKKKAGESPLSWRNSRGPAK